MSRTVNIGSLFDIEHLQGRKWAVEVPVIEGIKEWVAYKKGDVGLSDICEKTVSLDFDNMPGFMKLQALVNEGATFFATVRVIDERVTIVTRVSDEMVIQHLPVYVYSGERGRGMTINTCNELNRLINGLEK